MVQESEQRRSQAEVLGQCLHTADQVAYDGLYLLQCAALQGLGRCLMRALMIAKLARKRLLSSHINARVIANNQDLCSRAGPGQVVSGAADDCRVQRPGQRHAAPRHLQDGAAGAHCSRVPRTTPLYAVLQRGKQVAVAACCAPNVTP